MICIVQARMSSKRLPGKVLMNIGNHNVLSLIIMKLKTIKSLKNKIIIATSNHKSDRPIVRFCKKNKIKFYKGNLKNVALRFLTILKKNKTDYFLRISGDSPLIDPKIIKKILYFGKKKNFDLYTNLFPRTFPKGQSVELIKKKIFLKYYSRFKLKSEKEHVTKFFYKNPKLFKIKNLSLKKNYSKINMSIDKTEDLKKLKNILTSLNPKSLKNLGWQKLIKYYG